MPISQIGTNAIESGAVTAADLATGAVNLASSTVTGSLPAANGGTGTSAGVTGFKNRFINGNMVISQRGTTFNNPGSNQYTLDRWHFFVSVSNKINAAQSSVAPPGFINSMLVTSSSAYTVQADDYFQVGQGIEGLNISDLAWGTANAKTITISFWVRSSITGTFTCLLINYSATMNYPFNYTISSANTWTYVTQTIPGPTSGTFLTDINMGTELRFAFGIGSSSTTGTAGVWSSNYWAPGSTTSFMGTNGATWYMTGCQFEVGSAATTFDTRPYGTELQLCQRYCEVWNSTSENVCLSVMAPNPNNTFQLAGVVGFTVQKRTSPSISYSGAGTFNNVWLGNASTPSDVGFGSSGDKNMTVNITSSTNQGSYSTRLFLNGGALSSNYIIVSAEL